VHYAGDPGATAQNIHDYFDGTCITAKRYASCHYAVGLAGEIVQLIPESEISYCTNQANSYSISIETCHPDATGKFTDASEQALIELVAAICKKYGLNPAASGVIRHYDVTDKQCPLYYVTHPGAWPVFKEAVADCIAGRAYTLPSSGKNIGIFPVKSDTTGNFTVLAGHTYQFKITAPAKPALVNGSSPFKLISQSQSGDDYFFKFQAIGKPGDGCGFYLEGAKSPVAVATIK
jgi:N-acetylmuramoyl-L-alanine amidase